MNINANMEKLNDLLEKKHYYDSLFRIIQWDTEIHMPKDAIKHRNKLIQTLVKERHQLMVTDDFKLLLKDLKLEHNVNKKTKAIVNMLEKEFRLLFGISEELISECLMTVNESMHKWREAKEKQDYNLVEPYLKKIIQLNERIMDDLGYKENIYDAILDTYEPGLTVSKMNNLTDQLLEALIILRKKIENSQHRIKKNSCYTKEISIDMQKKICQRLLSCLGFDFNKGYICEDHFPSCTIIGDNDVRLTNFFGKDIMDVIWACLHEGGHGLYGQNISSTIMHTPVGCAPSTGFDEAQGKLFENIVGKSKEFWTFFYPVMQNDFNLFNNISMKDFFQSINSINISPIRLEADELTFNLHVIIRYEIERDLIDGDLETNNLKEIWEKKYKKYLGVVPQNDSQGILQDFHWFSGKFGYFPNYILANLYSAQIFHTMKQEIPNLLNDIKQGNFQSVLSWLSEKIYKHGAVYNSKEFMIELTGEELSAKYYIEYLTNKYKSIYKF